MISEDSKMLEDKLKGWVVKRTWRKYIKQCEERARFWGQTEKLSLEHGANPLDERIVRIKEIRLTYEEVIATLSSPAQTRERIEECIRKLEACSKREKAILADADKCWNEMTR
jgi:hypothetical protein